MKFLIFSDIHVHPWSAFATLNKRGLNTRLVELVSILKLVIKKAQEENCDAIFFCGDLFHLPKVDAVTYDLVARALEKVEMPLIMIPGNHDEATRMADFHTMRALHRRNIELFDFREGQELKCGGYRLRGIPFLRDRKRLLEEIKKSKGTDILLVHSGFAGGIEGFEYLADQDEAPAIGDLKLEERGISWVVAGHFHQPQILSKNREEPFMLLEDGKYKFNPGQVLIPGAPCQHTFSDMLSNRGYIVFSPEKKLVKFQTLPGPRFKKLEPEEFWFKNEKDLPSIVRDSYVSMKAPDKKSFKRFRDVLEEEARGYTLILDKKNPRSSLRPRLKIEDPQEKILEQYVSKQGKEGKEASKLLKMGLRILSEVESV